MYMPGRRRTCSLSERCWRSFSPYSASPRLKDDSAGAGCDEGAGVESAGWFSAVMEAFFVGWDQRLSGRAGPPCLRFQISNSRFQNGGPALAISLVPPYKLIQAA